MYRAVLFLLVFSLISGTFSSGILVAQDKVKEKEKDKDKDKEKKPEPKSPLDETFAGKTIGEWIKLLRTSENPKHRRAALIALYAGDAAGKTALPAVLNAVEKDKDVQVRQEGVNVLGRLGPKAKGSLQALIAALQTDPADEVREAAATALGNDKFKDAAADYVPAIADALKDKHAGTRVAVATTLRNMGESAKPAIPELIESAKNAKEHPLVRTAAVHVLSRYAKENSQTVIVLLDILKTADAPSGLREAAIEGLGRTAGESSEAVTELGATLTDKNLDLRRAAAGALGTLGAKAKVAWPAIKDRLGDEREDSGVRNHLIRLTGTLAKSNPEAIKTLTNVALDDKSTENRIAAIQELGELGSLPKESRDMLHQIKTRDPRASVREAAEKALKKVGG